MKNVHLDVILTESEYKALFRALKNELVATNNSYIAIVIVKFIQSKYIVEDK